jgi:hypothetical protein
MGTLELGGQTGNVCKEIYGAGESICMYLMFEALGKISDTSFGWKFPAAIFRASNTGAEQATSRDFVSVTNTILRDSVQPSTLVLSNIPAGTTAPLRLQFKVAKSLTAEPLFFNSELWFLPDFLLR